MLAIPFAVVLACLIWTRTLVASAHSAADRIAEVETSLAPLGAPDVAKTRAVLRGGLIVNVLTVAYKTKSLRAVLYRTPGGKIAELFLL